MLPKEFKSEFTRQLADVAYRQWRQLGIGFFPASETSTPHVIDLEALIVFTLLTAEDNKRLTEGALEWILKNRSWINGSRLKRLGILLGKQEKKTYDHSVLVLLDQIRTDSEEQLVRHITTLPGMEKFSRRGILSDLNLNDPQLLQLRLRALSGVNARAEILLFLLQHEYGNSNAMARDIGFAQKQVYLILENWTHANILHRIRKGRAGNYSLRNRKHWLDVLNISKTPEPLNWIQAFGLLVRIYFIMQESEDTYLLSSRSRDIADFADAVLLSQLGIHLPDPAHSEAESYFSPFADTIMKALNKLS